MTNRKIIVSGILTISILAILTKFSGLFRESVIASQFGTSSQMDLYSVISIYAGMIVSFFAFSSSTAYFPVFVGDVISNDKKYASKQLSHFINQFVIVNCIICLIIIIIAPELAILLSHNIAGISISQAIIYIRIISLTIITDGAVRLLITALNGIRQYGWLQTTQILFNLITIAFALLFSSKLGVGALVVAYLFNSTLQLCLLIYVCKKNGMCYEFKFNFKNKITINVWKSIIPVFLGSETYILGLTIDRTIGMSIGGVGVVSALNYSGMLYGLINSIISGPIITVFYTELSQKYNEQGIDGLMNILSKIINAVCIIVLPLSLFLLIEASDFVSVILQRGAFNAHSSLLTVCAFEVYVLICPIFALRNLFSRIFIILNQKKVLLKSGIIFLIANVLGGWLLTAVWGIRGVACGALCATLLSLLYMIMKARIENGINNSIFSVSFLKVLFSVVVSSIICLFLRKAYLFNPIVNLILYAFIFSFSYFLFLYITRCNELFELKLMITNSHLYNKFLKRGLKRSNYK